MTGYETTESGLSFLIKTASAFQQPGFYLLAALIALLPIVALGGRKARAVFFWPLILLAATVFNPYLFPALFVQFPHLVEKYYAFFWAVPVTFVLALLVTLISFRFSSHALRFLVLLAACACIAVTAVPSIMSYRDTVLPANVLKSEPEIVTLCDYIKASSEKSSPVIAFEKKDYAEEAAAYDASFILSDLLFGEEQDKELQTEAVEEDYIVVAKDNTALLSRIKELGFRAIAHTPENYIFSRAQ